jgi:hypothetical protein
MLLWDNNGVDLCRTGQYANLSCLKAKGIRTLLAGGLVAEYQSEGMISWPMRLDLLVQGHRSLKAYFTPAPSEGHRPSANKGLGTDNLETRQMMALEPLEGLRPGS